MANPHEKKFDDIINRSDEDVLTAESLNDVRESLDTESIQETLETFDQNQGSVTRTEDWQVSYLMLDKILNDERYEQERQRYFEEIAKNANISLEEGAENTQAQYETAFNHMTALKKKTFENIAPIAYADLQAELDEMMPIQRARKMLLDSGVKMQDPEFRDEIAQSTRIGYAFHQKFGDPEINYESELKKAAPQINEAFNTLSADKAKKFGMLAVMTAATGGSNLVVKMGIGALKQAVNSERVQNTFSKAVGGFDSFLQSKGVDTGPLKSAWSALKSQTEKAKEKLLGTKTGKAIVLAGMAGVALAVGDADLGAIWDRGVELVSDFGEGLQENSGINNIKSPMAGFDGVESNSVIGGEGYNVAENADWAAEQMAKFDDEITFEEIQNGLNDYQIEKLTEITQPTWDAKLVELYGDNIPDSVPKTMPPEMVQAIATDLANEAVASGASPSMTVMEHIEQLQADQIENTEVRVQGPFQENLDWNGSEAASEVPAQEAAKEANTWASDTPGPQGSDANSWAKDTPGASETYMDPRDNMVKLANVEPVSLTVEPGSSVYETVKAHMAEANGFPPSEQAVMQASADIIAESGIDDPSKVPAGFEFDFNANEYAYVDSVSEETVNVARFGADGVPDGLKGQTLGEIASGKFDAVGPVETRTTGQLMTEGAINGAVKSDIVNSIDKGLDPNMTIDDYMATMEKQVAALESNVPPVNLESKSSLAASLTNEKMDGITVPEGHAGPTESAGNKDALAQHYQERHDRYRDQGLGR